MSIYALKKVWELDVRPPSKKLVLLALADHQNEDSGRLDPSVRRIGARCGLTEKQARRYLRELQNEHIVEVTSNSKGGARPCSYSLNLTPPIGGSPPLPPKGATPPIGGSPPLPPKGATPPIGGSRIVMNLKLQNSETNLSLNPSHLERENQKTELLPGRKDNYKFSRDEAEQSVLDQEVYSKLKKSGWQGSERQVKIIRLAFANLPADYLESAIKKCADDCDNWTKNGGTKYLLEHVRRIYAEEQINKQPTGRIEVQNQAVVQAEQKATLEKQEESRKKIAEAFTTWPSQKIKDLKTAFEDSLQSRHFKNAEGFFDWQSKRTGLWGTVSGWLILKDPDFHKAITGFAPTPPKEPNTDEKKQNDFEVNQESKVFTLVKAGINEARAKFGGAT